MVPKRGHAPQTISPIPISAVPMITDRRRLTVSASTPVGTSKMNADASRVVPTSTSCRASSFATWIMNRPAAVMTIMKQNEPAASWAR